MTAGLLYVVIVFSPVLAVSARIWYALNTKQKGNNHEH